MTRFKETEQIRRWVLSQDWYQTIELSCGIITPGKFDTRPRLAFLEGVDFTGKRVLDIGCNAGQYSIYAKRRGADEVVGIDTNALRLEQAKTLADVEGLEITYLERSLFDLDEIGQFDIVFCFAVLTEVGDLFGAVDALKPIIGRTAFLELELAKPFFYLSRSAGWFRGRSEIPRMKSVVEVRRTKHGLMLRPSFEVLVAAFGDRFRLRRLGIGPRYDMVLVERTLLAGSDESLARQ